MAIEFNHTIVGARDKAVAAGLLAELLGRPEPTTYGPFAVVALDNGVNLDFMEHGGHIEAAHYAFLIAEEDFDAVRGRLEGRGIAYFADPGHQEPGINTHDGGRGLYFANPDGHNLEVITRTYGSGG